MQPSGKIAAGHQYMYLNLRGTILRRTAIKRQAQKVALFRGGPAVKSPQSEAGRKRFQRLLAHLYTSG